eukprot:CAMPEP_0176403506 /NCGR_PEP_ID=MMETSP0126-20121128/50156_1 /TAXON_ID=141414 ORGANISM="Strombidinopsis acuminatum, Strain SPMC142" /NCGR_SAMPLE_ID=MMETSP0126 /ASSEMBLY_ACC=CAM_ASM_000229 /LENGTH=82 /DNA_ID=CAMNT_0017781811 /DNA_START=599 /DNA_END=847 /DNA_ORIENTATION=+
MDIGEISNEFLPIVALTIPGSDSNAEDLVFKMTLVEYNKEATITLKFEFENPLLVSFQDVPDYALINLSPGKDDTFLDENGN